MEAHDLIKKIKKNWKLKDEYFIGQIRYFSKNGVQDKTKYAVVDVRRSDFSKINTSVYIVGKNDYLKIDKYNRYYKFSWKLAPNSTYESPRFYIDTSNPIEYFDPKAIVDCIHNDIINYPGSASQIIVKTLDTLKNQLTASGKEVFIYELLQNANDYPKRSVNSKIPVNVEFRLTKNYLIFQHTGDYFSPRNIAAICNINDKEKVENMEAIGYKGIGFKTVFLDNNYVYLKTGDYSFRFDWEDSKDILDVPWQILPIWTNYKSIDSEIKEVFDAVDSKDYRVQFALRPSKVATLYDSDSNYVKLFNEVFETERVLLFIPNINKVTFYCEGCEPIVRYKDSDKWCISDLSPAEISEDIREELNKEIEDGDTKIPEKYKNFYKTTIKFACRKKGEQLLPVEDTTLYCYLPAKKARLGLPFLMNTDMIPTGPRDDIEDLPVNYEICKIAGLKLCEWLSSLFLEGKYNYDSIFSLVPTFEEVTNYEKFIESIEEGFDEALEETALIPVLDGNFVHLEYVSNIIYDTTGISESGIFTDEDLLRFAEVNEWDYESQVYLPHPSLRGQENFNIFIEKYHNEEFEFNEEHLLEMCSNEDFIEWLKVQENNNKFLEFLLDNDYLSTFIEEKEIFIGDNGELYRADSMHYDIDEHLKYLYYFAEDYLLRLSVETREYFKNNKKWNSEIVGSFKEFKAEDFVSEVLGDSDMLSLLEDKDNSIDFLRFLALNDVENEDICDLPFFNVNNELIENFNRLVFFESERGLEVQQYEWLNDSIEFISNDYFNEYRDVCINYLKSRFQVLDYSDKEIVNRIINNCNYLDEINSSISEIESSNQFIDFINLNIKEFKENSLVNFCLIIINHEGEEIVEVAGENTFIYTNIYEELDEKKWLGSDWMYSLSDSYFEGKTETEKKKLKNTFIKYFGVRDLKVDYFVDTILCSNLSELTDNLNELDLNIDFWRWIKSNYKGGLENLTSLPILAGEHNGFEDTYILSENSIYMADNLLPEGQSIESIVCKYYEDALFVSSEYLTRTTVAERKSWFDFFTKLGIMSDQTELVFDQIIPNLSEIEDIGVPGMLQQVEEYFVERGVSISDLTSLRVIKKNGEFSEVSDCIFISTSKNTEPFKKIVLPHECDINKYNLPTRTLILKIAEEAGATIIDNQEDWRNIKLEQYLEIQDSAEELDEALHFNIIKEILNIDDKGKEGIAKKIKKINLKARDGKFYKQEKLTLGKEYNPICNFEANGIMEDALTYLSSDYSNFKFEDLTKKLRKTFNVHHKFIESDINLLSNFKFADFFWRRYVTHEKPFDSIKSMIESGKFKNKVCVPTPSGKVESAENLYSLKDLKDYRKLVIDWTSTFTFDDYPQKTYELLELLDFDDELSFNDGLNALKSTDDKLKRYFILKWMIKDYDSSNREKNDLISSYRESENSLWRNGRTKKCLLKNLYALDISSDSKYLEQYFKSSPLIIHSDYFSNINEEFYSECEMLQIKVIRREDMIFDPILLECNEDDIKDELRNCLLIVAAIECSEKWSEYYNSLCEKFDKLSFKKCKLISLKYSGDERIAQKAKQFYYDTEQEIFYFVGDLYDSSVFIDFIDNLLKVLSCEMDRDMFMQIFKKKSSLQEFEDFINEYCMDLSEDDSFRMVLKQQLGLGLEELSYEEDMEEPELLKVVTNSDSYDSQLHSDINEDFDEEEDDYDEVYHTEDADEVDAEEQENDTNTGVEAFVPEVPRLGKPTIIQSHQPSKKLKQFKPVLENLDDEEDDEPRQTMRIVDNNEVDIITSSSERNKQRSAYKGQWSPASDDNNIVKQRRSASRYSPDNFKSRTFDVGTQSPVCLSTKEVTEVDVTYLSNLLGRPLNKEIIMDQNYIVRSRFYNNLKETGLEMELSEKEFVENGTRQVKTKCGHYIHRCSARSGILYISPSVWNRLREERWIVCFYYGKMADQFVYVRTQEELMDIINKDALVIQVTGNDKKEIINKIYEDGFSNMNGNIYTLIRTIKVDGEVTPFDENIIDCYSDEDDIDVNSLL